MMPTVKGMSHSMIPNHVLRVGQTIRLHEAQEAVDQHPCLMTPGGQPSDSELDISLDHLNQLILELDPTFEPIQVNKSPSCVSPPTDLDEDVSHCMLVPRGCSPSFSIPIPTANSLSFRVNGMHGVSVSPTCSLPPLPFGSAPRRVSSPKHDMTSSLGSRLPNSNRNSVTSLHSMSTCSDTSYILGSTLSLASEDADAPEPNFSTTSGSLSDVSTLRHLDKPALMKPRHLQDLINSHGSHSSPASLSSSFSDIPVLLVNGAPESVCIQPSPGPEMDFIQTINDSETKPSSPHSFQARFTGSQPSMKFVMDTSKFWFRPHINRAEAEALVTDGEAGTFVIRDSTSYRGSFGLAMKVEQKRINFTATPYPGDSSLEHIRHFLIESSTKGVRIKGSSQEPYFGSLSALVYQHTISAYALPCKLLLHNQDLKTTEAKTNEKLPPSEEKGKTACNFIYLSAVPTEMLTGPCAVQRAVSSTFEKVPGSFTPTVVNMKVSSKGVTLTDINRKLFFRRHYPVHLLSYSGEDPDDRVWVKGTSFGARMFGFVAKGIEAGTENVCHVFAEYDQLQPCHEVVKVIQAAITRL
ncbi:tensin-4 [Cynoglossus semilaevis]|uniref:Tensin 4 n=1 Tax=Cynoglossus semilaevis TaxID=244447 RepID=A0A3P8WAK3_CYNSE|nr:tensin-4 [Cynoglossus semilaevis]XP_024914017.1 tensin-4 [Cynoglossus semilaevis]